MSIKFPQGWIIGGVLTVFCLLGAIFFVACPLCRQRSRARDALLSHQQMAVRTPSLTPTLPVQYLGCVFWLRCGHDMIQNNNKNMRKNARKLWGKCDAIQDLFEICKNADTDTVDGTNWTLDVIEFMLTKFLAHTGNSFIKFPNSKLSVDECWRLSYAFIFDIILRNRSITFLKTQIITPWHIDMSLLKCHMSM